MAITINVNRNVAALNVRHHLNSNSKDLGTRLERLSSGMRINRASDDASGVPISEGFRAQLSGMSLGLRNAEMGSNLLQVAEGSLNEVSSVLIRIRELAMASANSTYNDDNRESLENEIFQLRQEIDRIALSTGYNGQRLLTGFGVNVDESQSTALTASATTGVVRVALAGAGEGTFTFVDGAGDGELTLGNGVVTQTLNSSQLFLDGDTIATGTTAVANFDRLGVQVTLAGHQGAGASGSYVDGDLHGATIVVDGGTGGSFQVGADNVVEDRIEVGIEDMSASGSVLNLNILSVSSQAKAREALDTINAAIAEVARQRGKVGSVMNRLQHTISFTGNAIEGNTTSEATLRDADMATEVAAFTRTQILTQAATAMLAQANSAPQAVMTLLGR
ncbi:MAG: flagellin [Candidatus Handelsmanbacteria bacterium]|nr:flagellin [Candidatus Handelsmanbacteria bacterium]